MSGVFETFSSILGGTLPADTDDKPAGQKGPKQSNMPSDPRERALKRLYQGVEVRNRRYRFKEYKRCFVASEAVDFMVESGWASSREEAVLIGNQLQKRYNMFQHVVDPDRHSFEDKYLFFKFLDKSDEMSNSRDESEDNQSEHGRSSITQSLMTDTKKVGLITVGQLLKKGVNQKYSNKFNMEGFTAEEAVDYMVSVGLASSREDAVTIGLALQGVTGFIQNASNLMTPFSDSRSFFSFSQDEFISFNARHWKKDLANARDFFKENIKLQSHAFRLKTYNNTFTGKEAVDLFMIQGITGSRQDAVLLGRALMVEYNLFGHVTNEHEFEDSELFYVLGQR